VVGGGCQFLSKRAKKKRERLLAPAGAWVPPYTAPRHPLFLQENHSFVLEKFHDSTQLKTFSFEIYFTPFSMVL